MMQNLPFAKHGLQPSDFSNDKISAISLSASTARMEKEAGRGEEMKRRTPLLLVIAALSASLSHADTIFSNVGAGIPTGQGAVSYGASWEGSAGNYSPVAFKFTPTATATFTDALVDLYTLPSDGADSSVTASLYSDGDFETGGIDHLGSLLAQLDTTTAPAFDLTRSLPFDSYETSFTQISGQPSPWWRARTIGSSWLLGTLTAFRTSMAALKPIL
jgi:hypothetical protein